MGLFSKLFESFESWLKKHIKLPPAVRERVDRKQKDYDRLADILYERDVISPEDYREFYDHVETPYEKRIRRYMEKYPGATLKQARGHG